MAFVIYSCGSFAGIPCPHDIVTKQQDLLRHQTDKYRLSLLKRRRMILRCTHKQEHPDSQPSSFDDELKGIINVSVENNPTDTPFLEKSDRRVVDGITETGVKEIEDIADEVKEDLEDLQRKLEVNATKLIEEETQAVLEKYDQKRQELLDNLKKDREIISTEMERITELAKSAKSKQGMDKSKTLREKAYFLICSVFTISALYYAWNGLTDTDSAALTNAAIDAAVAAACAFAFSLDTRRD